MGNPSTYPYGWVVFFSTYWGARNLLKYWDRRERIEQEHFVGSLIEIIQRTREGINTRSLEGMVSRRRWVNQELCGKLLPLYEEGSIFDNRYSHWFRAHAQTTPRVRTSRPSLWSRRSDLPWKQAEEGSRCVTREFIIYGLLPLFISNLLGTSWRGGLGFKSPKFGSLPHFLPTPIGSTIYKHCTFC